MRNKAMFRAVLAAAVVFALGAEALPAQVDILDRVVEQYRNDAEAAMREAVENAIEQAAVTKNRRQSGGGISKKAKELKLDTRYNIPLPIMPKTKAYKFVVPYPGNITFSFEGHSSEGYFVFYNADGIALKPTGFSVSTGRKLEIRYHHFPSDVFGDTNDEQRVGFTWNNVSEKYTGKVVYKIDAGMYYCKISRNDLGASVFKLETQFKPLEGYGEDYDEDEYEEEEEEE